jgi:hypothetical protein
MAVALVRAALIVKDEPVADQGADDLTGGYAA